MKNHDQRSTQECRVGEEVAASLLVDHPEQVGDQQLKVAVVVVVNAVE